MMILGMRLEVFGEVGDTPRKERYLDLGRPGVAVAAGVIGDDPGFDVALQIHMVV